MTTEGKWELEQFSFDEKNAQVASRRRRRDRRVQGERARRGGRTDAADRGERCVGVGGRNGEWRCALHTESLAGDPYGRDRTRKDDASTVAERFNAALDALIEEVKADRSVLAAILCGSLSHDTVWAKSDIDLVFVTIDDRKTLEEHRSLDADGVNVHAYLVPRTGVPNARRRDAAEFFHAFAARQGPTALHARRVDHGARRAAALDRSARHRVQLLRAGRTRSPPIYKAHKWLVTRGDLDYTALWILYAATPLARIEVMARRLLADREVIPQAMTFNPDFFRIVYTDLLNSKKTEKNVEAALDAVDEVHGATRAVDVRAGHRAPAGGRRDTVVHGDRGLLHAPLGIRACRRRASTSRIRG